MDRETKELLETLIRRVNRAERRLSIQETQEFGGGGGASVTIDTFTPEIQGVGGNPSVSYVVQKGEYIQIEKFVLCRVEMATDSVSGGSGTMYVELPFLTPSPGNNLAVAATTLKFGTGGTHTPAGVSLLNFSPFIFTSALFTDIAGFSSLQISDLNPGSNGIGFTVTLFTD